MTPEVRYLHTELAFNYRMTNLQAALGVAQLEQIEDFIEKKRQIFEWYREELGETEGVMLNSQRPGTRNNYWMISLVLGDEVSISRDEFCLALKAAGVDTRPFFIPMSELPHLANYKTVGAENNECPVTAHLSRRGLNLPSGCGLTREQVFRVSQIVKCVLQEAQSRP